MEFSKKRKAFPCKKGGDYLKGPVEPGWQFIKSPSIQNHHFNFMFMGSLPDLCIDFCRNGPKSQGIHRITVAECVKEVFKPG